MPILTKPCKGKLSEQIQVLLRTSEDRADWGVYPCEICGQSVGVLETNGNWVLERHWPSVIYTPRKPSVGRYLAKTMIPAKLRMRPH
jgi:hypothetical protein